jgi:AraC-like DNA-binding protein
MPDGCRDVIWVQRPGAAPQVMLTQIDLAARQVQAQAGTAYVGFRLPPAAQLQTWPAPDAMVIDPDRLGDLVGAHLRMDHDVDAMLQALSQPGSTVAQAAAQTGLSLRSVERKFRHAALPRPDVWRQMARARRAAQQVGQADSLADLAAEAGYSDQAHMTRAFRRWFAASPRQIARDAALQASIAHSGLGNWTAVQSSIS